MMDRGFSLWLDTLRALAALVVLAGHLAHIRFTGGDYYVLREINIASDAVIVFFVISGVVIAYAAGRDGSLGRFAFNRLTRLLTVVLPALILTLAFDSVGTRIDMSAYPPGYYEARPLSDYILRGMTFTSEWQGLTDRLRLGSNGPLWSLSYEFAYYTLFAVAVFLRGALRLVLLALIAILVGIPILALLPAWAIGVFVWRRVSAPGAAPVPLPRAILMAVGAPLVLVYCRSIGIPPLLEALTERALVPLNHHLVLGYSNEVLWNSMIASFVALHLIGVHQLCRHLPVFVPERMAQAIRWCAGASFSLYVTHYPTLQLLDALVPATMPGHDLALLLGTLAVALVFAELFERPLARWRRLAAALGTPFRRTVAAG